MRLLLIIFAVFLHINVAVYGQTGPIQDFFFDNIGAIFFTENGSAVIAQDGENYKALVLNTERSQQRGKLIRSGKGPGEIERLYGYSFDKTKDEACFMGFHLRLICTDLEGKVSVDDQIPWFEFSGVSTPFKFFVDDSEILMPLQVLLSVEDPQEEINIGAISSIQNLEEVQYLAITLKNLRLDYLESLSLANNIFIKTRILRLSDEYIIVGIPGLPYFYVFKNGAYQSRIPIETEYEVSIEVSMKPEFPSPGVLIPANINNLQKLNGNHFLVARGNIHQEIPFGIDVYHFEEVKGELKIERKQQIELKDLPEDISEPNVTYQDGKAFIITNYIYFGYEVVVRDLELENMLNN